MLDVIDSVALITGGASGLGLAIARELLSRKAKAVALVDINRAGEDVLKKVLEEFGPQRAIFVQADVTNDEELKNAFETTVKTYSQLDVVVNSAGVIDEVNWKRCIRINLNASIMGTMLAVEEYLPKYAKKADPVVVNTSSVAAYIVNKYVPVYSATKSGIVAFTKTFGPSFDSYKVRVIAVSPGSVKTPIFDYIGDAVKVEHREGFKKFLANVELQDSGMYADRVVNLIQTAPSGSIWQIEDIPQELA